MLERKTNSFAPRTDGISRTFGACFGSEFVRTLNRGLDLIVTFAGV